MDLDFLLNSLDQIDLISIASISRRFDSKYEVDANFLSEFPNLKSYNGLIHISHSSQIPILANLKSNYLVVDLQRKISDPTLLLPLIKINGTVLIFNLKDGGNYSVKITDGSISFQNLDKSGKIKSQSMKRWFDLLKSQHVRILHTDHCDEDLLQKLPHNIEFLEMGFLDFRTFTPSHPLGIISGKMVDNEILHNPLKIHQNIHHLNISLRYDPSQILIINPQLKSVGFRPCTEKWTQSQIIKIINEVLDNWKIILFIWVPDWPTALFLKSHISTERTRVMIS